MYVRVVAISFVVLKGLGIVNKAFEKMVVELKMICCFGMNLL